MPTARAKAVLLTALPFCAACVAPAVPPSPELSPTSPPAEIDPPRPHPGEDVPG